MADDREDIPQVTQNEKEEGIRKERVPDAHTDEDDVEQVTQHEKQKEATK